MKFISKALDASREIYSALLDASCSVENFDALCVKHTQGEGGDISRSFDLEAEAVLVKHLSCFGQIYSEESGMIGDINDRLVVVDPIDGSDNFLSKIPYYGLSAALVENEKTISSFICNLANGDYFAKENGEVVFGNFQCNTSFYHEKNRYSPCGIFEKSYSNGNLCKIFEKAGIKYRSLGALAVSLAYAHRVNFVLFMGKTRVFDVAAGLHLCEDLHIHHDDNFLLVSQHKELFKTILDLLSEERGGE